MLDFSFLKQKQLLSIVRAVTLKPTTPGGSRSLGTCALAEWPGWILWEQNRDQARVQEMGAKALNPPNPQVPHLCRTMHNRPMAMLSLLLKQGVHHCDP